ncbi:transcriptional regulator [Castellaniella sp.]|uniref:helix-turn-helix transcriptional regulator n=1 Tax=Castellaniella sp. TaxID=1955812 RepID=UPI0035661AD7
MRTVPSPTPAEILQEKFLKPLGIAQYRWAREIGISQRRTGQIVAGKRAGAVNGGLHPARDVSLAPACLEGEGLLLLSQGFSCGKVYYLPGVVSIVPEQALSSDGSSGNSDPSSGSHDRSCGSKAHSKP